MSEVTTSSSKPGIKSSDVAAANFEAARLAELHKESLPSKPKDVQESRLNRFQVGDIVVWRDTSTFPEESHQGTVVKFTNVEGTYLLVEFDGYEKELTEDDVIRVG